MKLHCILPLVLCLLLPSCAERGRVDAAEFRQLHARSGQPHTMREVTYLGRKDGKVWLRERSMSFTGGKWQERIIHTDEADLDPVFRASLPVKMME